MCKTGTEGKGKWDRAPSEMVITRPYADVDVFTRSKMIFIRTISPPDLPRHPHDRSDDDAAYGRFVKEARENYNATAAAAATTTPATRTARRVALESSSATRTRGGDGGDGGGGDADGGLDSLRGSPWVAFAGFAVGGALGGVHSEAVRSPLALHSAAIAAYPS
jgi:hypothetical protein